MDSIILIVAYLLLIAILIVLIIGYARCFYLPLLYFWYSVRDIIGVGKPQNKKILPEDKSKRAEKERKRWIKKEARWNRLYFNPFVPFGLSSISIIYFAIGYTGIFTSVDISIIYSFMMAIYVAVYLKGMYERYQNDKKRYQEVLEANIAFTKICFIPIGFFISGFSLYMSFTGWHLDDISYIGMKGFICVYNAVMGLIASFSIKDNLKELLAIFVTIIPLAYVMAIFSMAGEYFVMKVILYRLDYEVEYLEVTNSLLLFKKRKRYFGTGYSDDLGPGNSSERAVNQDTVNPEFEQTGQPQSGEKQEEDNFEKVLDEKQVSQKENAERIKIIETVPVALKNSINVAIELEQNPLQAGECDEGKVAVAFQESEYDSNIEQLSCKEDKLLPVIWKEPLWKNPFGNS